MDPTRTAFSALVFLGLLGGCSSQIALTPEGSQVQHVERAELPGGCQLVSDVAIGIPPDAARPKSETELVMLMRNKSAELGGNHVVLESSDELRTQEGEPYYRGRGTAYDCPEPEPEPTSGGEVPAAEGGEGEGDPVPEEEVEEPAPVDEEQFDALFGDG